MTIDVVIPNYNRTWLLRRAVESVLAQQHIGVIYIVDDGSNEATLNYYLELLKLDSSLVILRNLHSGDPGKLRNLGIQNSKAEWIGFLDSDDYWEPDRINQIRESLDDPQLILYCSNAKKLSEDSLLPVELYHSMRPSKKFRLHDLLVENFIITSTVLARRSALLAAGGFSTGKLVKNCEDFATWLRLAILGDCYFDSRANVVYTYSESSYSRNRGHNLDSKAFSDFIRWVWESEKPISQKFFNINLVIRVRAIRFIRRTKSTFSANRR